MEKLTICYEFEFRLTVRKRNGKLYKGHHLTGIGLSFNLALWDIFHTLEKRKSQIVAIQEVKPVRVAFAFDQNLISVKTTINENPPVMPMDIEKELKTLPTI